MEMIIGQDCFHAIRPLEIHNDKSRISPFAVRLPIGWVLRGPLPSTLGFPSYCFKCSVEDNSLVEQVKTMLQELVESPPPTQKTKICTIGRL